MLVLASVALLGGWALAPPFGLCVGAYLLLTLCYSLLLKRLVIVDVLTIAMGFVLRAAAGGAALGVVVTPWLLLCTLTLAVFLGLGKRRHELLLLEESAGSHREALDRYSVAYLDMLMTISAATAIITYALYTLAPETVQRFQTSSLVLTTPFVLYGVFRYLFLVRERNDGGDPGHTLSTDSASLVNLALWAALVSAVIYLPRGWFGG